MKSCEVPSVIIPLRSGAPGLSKPFGAAKRERKHKDRVGRGVLEDVLGMQLMQTENMNRLQGGLWLRAAPHPDSQY